MQSRKGDGECLTEHQVNKPLAQRGHVLDQSPGERKDAFNSCEDRVEDSFYRVEDGGDDVGHFEQFDLRLRMMEWLIGNL